ncbi:hypothetical protein GCM10010124_08010 [Pilimelia terevasa]|uniref:Uncharacterized protein n=1 Tax=Pilimelia terevasa TaxID=53372 RepID=A0A8J3BFM4_9ACTN|nr:hypothetical protein [Pilimelia terevasa]GGK17844.1 hypothetical protein GCM10010124_08010 [Pilimelia terevasa]
MNSSMEPGEALRVAWIAGVHRHHPGEPRASYVTPWADTPLWERAAAAAVEEQVRRFVEVTGGAAGRLTPTQRGQFVALCWLGQMYRHFGDPKPGYVADWAQLPPWQQATDIDIFDALAGHRLGAFTPPPTGGQPMGDNDVTSLDRR